MLLQANLAPEVEPPTCDSTSNQVYRDSLVHSKRDVHSAATKTVRPELFHRGQCPSQTEYLFQARHFQEIFHVLHEPAALL